ncbi:MAG: flagellar biosynthesis anti-sigma factor FlgM [Kofleriaceae bacterium]
MSRPGPAAASDETSPVMSARLDKIRAMLDTGTYPIDLDQLASRIVDDEWLRGGSR